MKKCNFGTTFENFGKYFIFCQNYLFQTLKNSNSSGKAKALLIEKRMINLLNLLPCLFHLILFLFSSACSSFLFPDHLAKHPEVQEKLYDEIQACIAKDGNLTADSLMKMRYLKACQQESQRLLPVTSGVSRETQVIFNANLNFWLYILIHCCYNLTYVS